MLRAFSSGPTVAERALASVFPSEDERAEARSKLTSGAVANAETMTLATMK